MSIEIPPELQWVFSLLGGQRWPKGDEDGLWNGRDLWYQTAGFIDDLVDEFGPAANQVLSSVSGQLADSFGGFARQAGSYLPQLSQGGRQLGDALDQAGMQIQYSKLMLIATAAWMAYQILQWAGIFPEIVPMVLGIGSKIAELIWVRLLAEAGANVGAMVGMDVAVQGLQKLLGARKSWDGTSILGSFESGLLGFGIGMGVFGAAGKAETALTNAAKSESASGKVALGAGGPNSSEGLANNVSSSVLKRSGDQNVLAGTSSDLNGLPGANSGASESKSKITDGPQFVNSTLGKVALNAITGVVTSEVSAPIFHSPADPLMAAIGGAVGALGGRHETQAGSDSPSDSISVPKLAPGVGDYSPAAAKELAGLTPLADKPGSGYPGSAANSYHDAPSSVVNDGLASKGPVGQGVGAGIGTAHAPSAPDTSGAAGTTAQPSRVDNSNSSAVDSAATSGMAYQSQVDTPIADTGGGAVVVDPGRSSGVDAAGPNTDGNVEGPSNVVSLRPNDSGSGVTGDVGRASGSYLANPPSVRPGTVSPNTVGSGTVATAPLPGTHEVTTSMGNLRGEPAGLPGLDAIGMVDGPTGQLPAIDAVAAPVSETASVLADSTATPIAHIPQAISEQPQPATAEFGPATEVPVPVDRPTPPMPDNGYTNDSLAIPSTTATSATPAEMVGPNTAKLADPVKVGTESGPRFDPAATNQRDPQHSLAEPPQSITSRPRSEQLSTSAGATETDHPGSGGHNVAGGSDDTVNSDFGYGSGSFDQAMPMVPGGHATGVVFAGGTRWVRDGGGWYVAEHTGVLETNAAGNARFVNLPAESKAVVDGSGVLRHVVLPDGVSYDRDWGGRWSRGRHDSGELIVRKLNKPVPLEVVDPTGAGGWKSVVLPAESEVVHDKLTHEPVAYRQVKDANGTRLSEPRTFVPNAHADWVELGTPPHPAEYEAWLAGANKAHEAARVLYDIATRSGPDVPDPNRLTSIDDNALRALLHGTRDDAIAAIYEAVRRQEGVALRWTQLSASNAFAEGKVVNMAAGEGKSWLFLVDAARQSVRPGVDAVHVITTRGNLADREFDHYQQMLAPLGFDVHRMNPDQLPPEPKDGRPTIYIGTSQDVGFTFLKAEMVPGQSVSGRAVIHASVDEIDEAFVYSNTQYILSAGARGEAPSQVAAPVRWAKDFLVQHMDSGQLTATDFGRGADQHGGPAVLTAAGKTKIEHILGRSLTAAERKKLDMAATAHWEYVENVHYVKYGDKVYIIDQTTHEVLYDPETSSESRWNGGLAQAIEAKHGLPIRDDPATNKGVTAQQLYAKDRYQQVVGASGTALGKGELFGKQGLSHQIEDIPRYYESGLSTGADHVSPDLGTKLDTIAEHVRDMQKSGTQQPQLILAHRNDLVAEISGRLGEMGVTHTAIDAKWFLDQGTNRDAAFKDVVSAAGQRGRVLVINMQGARGVDIPISNDVKVLGGLHVRVTAHSDVSRDIDIQAENRAARSGDPGSVSYYISPDDAAFQLSHHPDVQLAVIRYTDAYKADDTNSTPTTRTNLTEAEQQLRDLVPGLQTDAAQHFGTYRTSTHQPNAPPPTTLTATPATDLPQFSLQPPPQPPAANPPRQGSPLDDSALLTRQELATAHLAVYGFDGSQHMLTDSHGVLRGRNWTSVPTPGTWLDTQHISRLPRVGDTDVTGAQTVGAPWRGGLQPHVIAVDVQGEYFVLHTADGCRVNLSPNELASLVQGLLTNAHQPNVPLVLVSDTPPLRDMAMALAQALPEHPVWANTDGVRLTVDPQTAQMRIGPTRGRPRMASAGWVRFTATLRQNMAWLGNRYLIKVRGGVIQGRDWALLPWGNVPIDTRQVVQADVNCYDDSAADEVVDAPWAVDQRNGAHNVPEPWLINVEFRGDQVVLRSLDRGDQVMSAEEFADLIMHDPELAKGSPDTPLVLISSEPADGGLDVVRIIAIRTGRPVYTHTGGATLSFGEYGLRQLRIFPARKVNRDLVPVGRWLRVDPHGPGPFVTDRAARVSGVHDDGQRSHYVVVSDDSLLTRPVGNGEGGISGRIYHDQEESVKPDALLPDGRFLGTIHYFHSEDGPVVEARTAPWVDAAGNVPRIDIRVAHGAPGEVALALKPDAYRQHGATVARHINVPAGVFADRLVRRPSIRSLSSGVPLLLAMCSGGKAPESDPVRRVAVAQEVANTTGRTVYAATGPLWIRDPYPQRQAGLQFIGPGSTREAFVTFKPEPSAREILRRSMLIGLSGDIEITRYLGRLLREVFGADIDASPEFDVLFRNLGALERIRRDDDDLRYLMPWLTSDVLHAHAQLYEQDVEQQAGATRQDAIHFLLTRGGVEDRPAEHLTLMVLAKAAELRAQEEESILRSAEEPLQHDVAPNPAHGDLADPGAPVQQAAGRAGGQPGRWLPTEQGDRPSASRTVEQAEQNHTVEHGDQGNPVGREPAVIADPGGQPASAPRSVRFEPSALESVARGYPGRIDDQLDERRPSELVRGWPIPGRNEPVMFTDGSRILDYVNEGARGISQTMLRGVKDILGEIRAKLPDPVSDQELTKLVGAVGQAMRREPWTFRGADGRVFTYRNAEGLQRQVHITAIPYLRDFERFTDDQGDTKLDNVYQGGRTGGTVKNITTQAGLTVPAALGPQSHVFGRIQGRISRQMGTGYQILDSAVSRSETRLEEGSHLHVTHLRYDVTVTGESWRGAWPTRSRVWSTTPLANFGFVIRWGLAVRLGDSSTAPHNFGRVPREIQFQPGSSYSVANTEGLGSTREMLRWAAERFDVRPGSTAYQTLERFLRSDSLHDMADMLRQGQLPSPPLRADDRSRTLLGSLIVERVVPRRATLIDDSVAVEMRAGSLYNVGNLRSLSRSWAISLSGSAGLNLDFPVFPGGNDLRVLGGPAVLYTYGFGRTRLTGGDVGRSIMAQYKGLPTALYKVENDVYLRTTRDSKPTTFTLVSLDRMPVDEALRLAGWYDGTTVRRLTGAAEPNMPAHLTPDHPVMLGMHRVHEFTFPDGRKVDDNGRTFVDHLADRVVDAVAHTYPGMVARMADLADPKSPLFRNKTHYEDVFANTLALRSAVSYHALAGNMDALATIGFPVRLIEPDRLTQRYRTIIITAELTGRRYVGTRVPEGMAQGLPGSERITSQHFTNRSVDASLNVSVAARDVHIDHVSGAPKNSGTLGMSLGLQRTQTRTTIVGSVVTNEPAVATLGPSHLVDYTICVSVSSDGFGRLRNLVRHASFGLLGTQPFVFDEPKQELVGGEHSATIEGRVRLAISDDHSPENDPHAAGTQNPYRRYDDAISIRPMLAGDARALGRGDLSIVRPRAAEYLMDYHNHLLVPIAVASHALLLDALDQVLVSASGDSWIYTKPGSPPRDAISRAVHPLVMAGNFDQMSSPMGLRLTGLFGKAPYLGRSATAVLRTNLANMRADGPPKRIDIEHKIGVDFEVGSGIANGKTFSLGVSAVYTEAHPVGPHVLGAYGMNASVAWSTQRSRMISRTVSLKYNLSYGGHQYLVRADHELEIAAITNWNAVAGLVKGWRPSASGIRAILPAGFAGQLPERSAHQMGLVNDGVGPVPTYGERPWTQPALLRDNQFGSFPVDSPDATRVLEKVLARLAMLDVPSADQEAVRTHLSDRALRALLVHRAETGTGLPSRTNAGVHQLNVGGHPMTLRFEVIVQNRAVEGLWHSMEPDEDRIATEAVSESDTASRLADAGVAVSESVSTQNKVATAVGPSHTDDSSTGRSVRSRNSTTAVRHTRVTYKDPQVQFRTSVRVRVTIDTGKPDERNIIEEDGGHVTELLPVTLVRPGTDDTDPGLIVAPDRSVTVWAQASVTGTVIERWRANTDQLPEEVAAKLGDGIAVRRLIGEGNLLDASMLSVGLAAGRDITRLTGARGGAADNTGYDLARESLADAVREARDTRLTRPGGNSAEALEGTVSNAGIVGFLPDTLSHEGYQAAGVTDENFVSGARADLRVFSKPDSTRRPIIVSLTGQAALETTERSTEGADVTTSRTGGQTGGLGLNQTLVSDPIGTASPAPAGTGYDTSEVTGRLLGNGTMAVSSLNESNTGRSFLMYLPWKFLQVAIVARVVKGSLFDPLPAAATETEGGLWAIVREDRARELGWVSDQNFPDKAASAWKAVAAADQAWENADKAYWQQRRRVSGLRTSVEDAEKELAAAGTAMWEDAARDLADEAAVNRLIAAEEPLAAARLALDDQLAIVAELHDAADRAAEQMYDIRKAAHELTDWYQLRPAERIGTEPPEVTFTPPEQTQPQRPAFTELPGADGRTIGLTTPAGETLAVHDVPEDGHGFFHAAIKWLRAVDPAAVAGTTTADLRALLAARLEHPDNADLAGFATLDAKDPFTEAEVRNAAVPLGTRERREFDALGTISPSQPLDETQRTRLAASQTTRAGDITGDFGKDGAWDHGAADLWPVLFARTFNARVTVVTEGGRYQEFLPDPRRPAVGVRSLVLYLSDRHYRLATPGTPDATVAHLPAQSPADHAAVIDESTPPLPAHERLPWAMPEREPGEDTGSSAAPRFDTRDHRRLRDPDGQVYDLVSPAGRDNTFGGALWTSLRRGGKADLGQLFAGQPLPDRAQLQPTATFLRTELDHARITLTPAQESEFERRGGLLPASVRAALTEPQRAALIRAQLSNGRRWDANTAAIAAEMAAHALSAERPTAVRLVWENGTYTTFGDDTNPATRVLTGYERGGEFLAALPRPAHVAPSRFETIGSRQQHVVNFDGAGSKELSVAAKAEIDRVVDELARRGLTNWHADRALPVVRITGYGNGSRRPGTAQEESARRARQTGFVRARAVEQYAREVLATRLARLQHGRDGALLHAWRFEVSVDSAGSELTLAADRWNRSMSPQRLRRAVISIDYLPEQVVLGGARGTDAQVPHAIRQVWLGGEFSESTQHNIQAWLDRTRQSDWQHTLMVDTHTRQANAGFFDRLAGNGSQITVIDNLLFDHLDEPVRGGVSALYQFAIRQGAFRMAADVVRFVVSARDGGVLVDPDVAPGTVQLPTGAIPMDVHGVPFLAPSIQNRASLDEILARIQTPGRSDQQALQDAVDWQYDHGHLGNSVIVTPPSTDFFRTVLADLPRINDDLVQRSVDGPQGLDACAGSITGPTFLTKKIKDVLLASGDWPALFGSDGDWSSVFRSHRLRFDPIQRARWDGLDWLAAADSENHSGLPAVESAGEGDKRRLTRAVYFEGAGSRELSVTARAGVDRVVDEIARRGLASWRAGRRLPVVRITGYGNGSRWPGASADQSQRRARQTGFARAHVVELYLREALAERLAQLQREGERELLPADRFEVRVESGGSQVVAASSNRLISPRSRRRVVISVKYQATQPSVGDAGRTDGENHSRSQPPAPSASGENGLAGEPPTSAAQVSSDENASSGETSVGQAVSPGHESRNDAGNHQDTGTGLDLAAQWQRDRESWLRELDADAAASEPPRLDKKPADFPWTREVAWADLMQAKLEHGLAHRAYEEHTELVRDGQGSSSGAMEHALENARKALRSADLGVHRAEHNLRVWGNDPQRLLIRRAQWIAESIKARPGLLGGADRAPSPVPGFWEVRARTWRAPTPVPGGRSVGSGLPDLGVGSALGRAPSPVPGGRLGFWEPRGTGLGASGSGLGRAPSPVPGGRFVGSGLPDLATGPVWGRVSGLRDLGVGRVSGLPDLATGPVWGRASGLPDLVTGRSGQAVGTSAAPPPLITIEMQAEFLGEDQPGNLKWQHLGTWVRYLNAIEREAYRIRVGSDGLLYDSRGRLFNTIGHNRGVDQDLAIFVADPSGRLYANCYPQVGLFHHSSFLAGGPVSGAGMMRVNLGLLELLTDKSGHYRPERRITRQTVNSLRRQGLHIRDDQIIFYAPR